MHYGKTNPENLSKEYVGPNYGMQIIKTPNEMGMSGNASSISSNIAGIMNYIHILANGGGPASKNYELLEIDIF